MITRFALKITTAFALFFFFFSAASEAAPIKIELENTAGVTQKQYFSVFNSVDEMYYENNSGESWVTVNAEIGDELLVSTDYDNYSITVVSLDSPIRVETPAFLNNAASSLSKNAKAFLGRINAIRESQGNAPIFVSENLSKIFSIPSSLSNTNEYYKYCLDLGLESGCDIARIIDYDYIRLSYTGGDPTAWFDRSIRNAGIDSLLMPGEFGLALDYVYEKNSRTLLFSWMIVDCQEIGTGCLLSEERGDSSIEPVVPTPPGSNSGKISPNFKVWLKFNRNKFIVWTVTTPMFKGRVTGYAMFRGKKYRFNYKQNNKRIVKNIRRYKKTAGLFRVRLCYDSTTWKKVCRSKSLRLKSTK